MSETLLPLSRLLGQEPAVSALVALAASGDPVPPLLLHGPAGVGKRTAALAFAAALVCRKPSGHDACGRCRHCSRIGDAGAVTALRAGSTSREAPRTYPDAGLVSVPARKTRISILQARDIALSLSTRPFELPRRVYVVDPADRLTPAAANALLKTLEEPPAWAVLVLVTAAPWSLPITVRSRLRAVRFAPLETDVIRELLEREGVAAPEAGRRAALARGDLARAREIDPDEEARAIESWVAILADLADRAHPGLLAVRAGEEHGGSREEATRALGLLLDILRDVAVSARGGRPRLLDADQLERLAHARERVAGGWLDGPALVDALARESHVFHRNPRLALEGAVLGLAGRLDRGALIVRR